MFDLLYNDAKKCHVITSDPCLEEWYRIFFDKSPDAILVLDCATYSVLAWNSQAEILLNLDPKDSRQRQFTDFKEIYNTLRQTKQPTILKEIILQTSASTHIHVESMVRLVKTLSKNILIVSLRESAEKSAMQASAIQSEKMMLLGQLSASIAHEIRNPLAAMNLSMQMLLRSTEFQEKAHKHIAATLAGIERITTIVDTTLNFAKPLPPKLKPVNIHSSICDSIELCSDILERNCVTVTTDFLSNAPMVQVDESQINQIMINLLTNACDALRIDGHIHIRTILSQNSSYQTMLAILVQDNGVGIPQEDVRNIFLPFFTRKAEGTGLGLTIAKRILELHNGDIHVSSIIDQGTCVTVYLPVVQ